MGKIGSNTIIVTLERIIQLILGLFVSGLIARYLTIEEFALWQLALQLLPYVGVIGLICGAEVILPKLSSHMSERIIINAFILRIIFGSISVAIGLIAIYFLKLPNPFNVFSTILLFTLLINEPFAVFACYLQSKVENIPLSFVRLSSVGVRTGIVIIVIYFRLNIYFLAVAWLIESILVSIGYFLCFKVNKNRDITLKPELIDTETMKALSAQGILFMFGQLLLMTASRADRIIATKYTSSFFSGNYLAVTQLIDSVFQIATVINIVFITSFLYNKSRSAKQDITIIIKLAIFYLLISLIGSTILFYSAEFIITLIYGLKFTAAILLLKEIAFTIPLFTCSLLLNAYMFKHGMYKNYLMIYFFTLLMTSIYLSLIILKDRYDLLIFSTYIYCSASIAMAIIFITRSKNET